MTSLAYSLKVFKALKFLKALRLISRNQALQIALRALIFAIPNVTKFTVIMGLFFMIFAVVSVSFFKGKMYHCIDIESLAIGEEILSKWQCLLYGGKWEVWTYNFDNIVNAMITLFVMSTNIGWGEIFTHAVTSAGIDYQ